MLEINPQIAKEKRNKIIKCFDYSTIPIFDGIGRGFWIKKDM